MGWKCYQGMTSRENDSQRFIFLLCGIVHGRGPSSFDLVFLGPLIEGKALCLLLVLIDEFQTFILHCGLQMWFQKRAFACKYPSPPSHGSRSCLPEVQTSVQNLRSKGCSFWFVVSSLSVSLL